LILGSASRDLLRQSSESLAGRIAYVAMGPFDILEIAPAEHAPNDLGIRGGFPDSFLAKNDSQSLNGARILSTPIWSVKSLSLAREFRQKPWSVSGPCWRTAKARCSTHPVLPAL
jgi:hypothetical protein